MRCKSSGAGGVVWAVAATTRSTGDLCVDFDSLPLTIIRTTFRSLASEGMREGERREVKEEEAEGSWSAGCLQIGILGTDTLLLSIYNSSNRSRDGYKNFVSLFRECQDLQVSRVAGTYESYLFLVTRTGCQVAD